MPAELAASLASFFSLPPLEFLCLDGKWSCLACTKAPGRIVLAPSAPPPRLLDLSGRSRWRDALATRLAPAPPWSAAFVGCLWHGFAMPLEGFVCPTRVMVFLQLLLFVEHFGCQGTCRASASTAPNGHSCLPPGALCTGWEGQLRRSERFMELSLSDEQERLMLFLTRSAANKHPSAALHLHF